MILLIHSSHMADGIAEGLQYGVTLLLPALLPFMVFSSFVIRSGISEKAGRLISPVMKKIFRLPGSCGAAVILSLTGGFPVGAKCVRLLYERGEIDAEQAEQMMMFCVCSGPAFLITGVGELMTGDITAGIILYLSQVISGILLGWISGRIYQPGRHSLTDRHVVRKPENPVKTHADTFRPPDSSGISEDRRNRKGLSVCFVESCADGAQSMIALCTMVAIFSGLIAVAEAFHWDQALAQILILTGVREENAGAVFRILTEVTGACRKLSDSGAGIWMLGAATGFGGLCVHFQIFSILGDLKLNKLRFWLFRTGNAFLSGIIVYLIRSPFHSVREVFAETTAFSVQCSAGSGWGMAALLLMCVVFVLSLKTGTLRQPLPFRRK